MNLVAGGGEVEEVVEVGHLHCGAVLKDRLSDRLVWVCVVPERVSTSREREREKERKRTWLARTNCAVRH
jgi:hypothetical protein